MERQRTYYDQTYLKTIKLREKWLCTSAIPEFDERQRQEWETQPSLRLTQKLQKPEQCGMSENMEHRSMEQNRSQTFS